MAVRYKEGEGFQSYDPNKINLLPTHSNNTPSSSGGGSGGSSSLPEPTPADNIINSGAVENTKKPNTLNEQLTKIQDYYVSQINSGVKYTPEKLSAIKKDFGVSVGESGEAFTMQYVPRELDKGTGYSITPEGNVYSVSSSVSNEPNLYGGESISPALPSSFKDVVNNQIGIETYIEYKSDQLIALGVRRFTEGKTTKLFAGETPIPFLTTPVEIGKQNYRLGNFAIPVTESLKYAFFFPAMITTTETYTSLIRTGQIEPIAETIFISKISNEKVATLSKTEIGGLKSYGIIAQEVKDVGEFGANIGKGYGINYKEMIGENKFKDLSGYKVVSRNTPTGDSFIKLSQMDKKPFGEGVISESITKEISSNAIQIRYRKTIGAVTETSKENIFVYVGSKDYIKALTNKGLKYRIYNPEIKGFIIIEPASEVKFIGGVKSFSKQKVISFSSTGVTQAEAQEASLRNVIKQSLKSVEPLERLSNLKYAVTKQQTQTLERPALKQKIKTSPVLYQRNLNKPSVNLKLASSSVQSLKQPPALNLKFRQVEVTKLRQEQPQKVILKEGQAEKLRFRQKEFYRITTPDITPKTPRTPIRFMPKFPVSNLNQGSRKSIGKKNIKQNSFQVKFYQPSFTARALNIKQSFSKKQFKNIKEGDMFRPIPVLR